MVKILNSLTPSYSLKGLIIGVVFAAVYLLLAFVAAGAGHGTALFFAVLFPYGLGLLFFPAIGFLADNLDSFLTRSLLLVGLAIHYGLIYTCIKILWVEDFPYLEKMWNCSSISVILPAAFYLLGNIVVYDAFIRSFKHRGDEHDCAKN